MLYPMFRYLNEILVRWAMKKYKRLRRRPRRARRFIADVARRQPGLFAHWRLGVRHDGWTMGPGEPRNPRRVLQAQGARLPRRPTLSSAYPVSGATPRS
jgi:hypothetical protein